MSGFGGFGGFGQNNNQQQSTGFGGFGANTNTNAGFGASNNTGFGAPANNTGGGLFGGGATSGFGNSGGFGATQNQNNTAFGAKPTGFGATTTGGGLFGGGGGTATTGTTFGGFGTNAASTSSPFGANSNNTSGGLFGNKTPAFGTSNTTPANPFGGGANNSPFGNTTGAFGAPASTALSTGAGECQGTGNVQFSPFVEKEANSTTNQQNSYQNISFQQPYQKFSVEELRLADYTQGRRFGNASNQPGAFGTNSNFGGFGANNNTTGGFGNTNTGTGSNPFGGTSSTPFGTSQPASGGFGSNTATTGGNLFGAKPAAPSLFGGQTQNQPSNGLFGNTAATTGFGSNAATGGGFGANNNTGSNIFGNTNTAPKTAFSFNPPAASAGTGFGTTPAATGGGFGSGSNLFGGNTGQPQNTSTPFGTQQQPAANNIFGGFGATQTQTGTSNLFGTNNQQKPATGVFNNAAGTSGTGLFGNQPAAASSNLFGAPTNTQNTGGNLFGQKPATTGIGLFGSANNAQANTTGSNLFSGFGGNQNNQTQPQQPSLFGSLNNSQQKPGLFAQTQPQAGNTLFDNSGTQQGGGLFSNLQQQQQQQPQNSLLGNGSNSIFGNSQQAQQGSQSYTTSISDNAAFGSPSLFQDLGSSQIQNRGPIATPLSSSVKQKKTAALPMYKLNPASSSRFSTPQKRGFGFSYSAYNSPNSVSSSASTPVKFNNSMLGGNTFNRGLGKSLSTNNIRRIYTENENILAPGAFSASSSSRQYGSTGSVKKLIINRSIRNDLFSPPSPQPEETPASSNQGSALKKRVSFESSSLSAAINGASSPLKQVQNNPSPTSEELGYIRPSNTSNTNGVQSDGVSHTPEMEQVKNNELAVVVEEDAASVPSPSTPTYEDLEVGDYWMKPSKKEIENMNHVQRQKVSNFTIGREGVGHVVFNSPVDLSKINLDNIYGKLAILETRRATIYPDDVQKPKPGQGLNVPSTITLYCSWPLSIMKKRSQHTGQSASFQKHIDFLKSDRNPEFVSFDPPTGTWVFKVEHFTTYGLVYDENDNATDGEEVSGFGESTLSAPPDTPTPETHTPRAHLDESFASTSQLSRTESDPEDTFEFRKKKVLPGAFDNQEIYEDNEEMEDSYGEQDQESFLDERSVGSQSENGVDELMGQDDVSHDDESVSIVDQEMAGSFPQAGITAELNENSHEDEDMGSLEDTPGAIMKARMRAKKNSETPLKGKFNAGDDWANTLKTTISPQKQDRALLKSLIDINDNDHRPDTLGNPSIGRNRVVSEGRGFATSIDMMNSLWGQAKSPTKIAKVPSKGKGFEWPYAKRFKTNDNTTSMTDADRAFHDSLKPSWGPDGTLVYAAPANSKPFGRSSRRAREKDGLMTIQKGGVVSESRDIRFAKFSNELSGDILKKQKSVTNIIISDGVPLATLDQSFTFSDFFEDLKITSPSAIHEKLVWELASILFDEIDIPKELDQIPTAEERVRKDNLSAFWQKLVDQASSQHVAMARSNEEKAIASLTGHKVADACGHLLNGKDFHLATLVALIGSKESMKKDIRKQINQWQESLILSEFSQPVRTIYEILAGNVSVCDGLKGPPEDRIESFIISKRFGLDWRQAFGLRLWYAISATEEIGAAVDKFSVDIQQDKETAKPQAWYVEQQIPTLWKDDDIEKREDLLWGLLKVYAFRDADLESTLRPENSQLSPLDVRLSWQLGRALTSCGDGVGYLTDADEKADQATLSFASQLTNEGKWLDAVFVLLHLSAAASRATSVQSHLARYAGLIGSEDSESFTTLTQNLMIPATWVWEAKALYMRSVKKDPNEEVECLIKACSFEEAHRTFVKEVAPKTIIERDYVTLRTLLDGLRGKESLIPEWHLGGEIYLDFLSLLDYQKKAREVDMKVLERLLAALPAVVEDSRNPVFLERVATEIISGVVAKFVVDLGKNCEKADLPKVLRLPLTEDTYLKHTVDLSLGYYRSVMQDAR
ncbi:hypothetical protein B7494_g6901 [Chlorociboria aeruginascens]|nr:hypothetical protein B7494_g6901 [Chlorociboria aeruginascens]